MNHLWRTFVRLNVATLVVATFGCQPVTIDKPTTDEIVEGELEVEVSWGNVWDSSTFVATVNGFDVSSDFDVSETGAEATLDVLPGKKLLTANLPAVPLLGAAATIFTYTTDAPRETFIGGKLIFEPESSFMDFPW